MCNRKQHQFVEMILACSTILSLSDKHGKYSNMAPEKEKIECFNFLSINLILTVRAKMWVYSQGAECVQIKPVGLCFTGNISWIYQEEVLDEVERFLYTKLC